MQRLHSSRRTFLAALALLPWAGVRAATRPPRLAASWREEQAGGSVYRLGILEWPGPDSPRIIASLELPTRGHGVIVEADGSLLAVARRPGNWLLRWNPYTGATQWQWSEPGHTFNGHVLASNGVNQGSAIYSIETHLDSGAGLVGVRDARSLEKLREWPTQGIDPHQVLWDRIRPGHLIVANGGVATRPETGRAKIDLPRMDASLVRMDIQTGAVRGQWRLDDPRLSLRHLAWGRAADNTPRLGVALQAEHDAIPTRASAPILALFDGKALRAIPPARTLAGYGGDIAALDDAFVVSCPRAHGLALFGVDGNWRGFVPLEEACALARSEGHLWAGGREQARAFADAGGSSAYSLPGGLRLDNHWVSLS